MSSDSISLEMLCDVVVGELEDGQLELQVRVTGGIGVYLPFRNYQVLYGQLGFYKMLQADQPRHGLTC